MNDALSPKLYAVDAFGNKNYITGISNDNYQGDTSAYHLASNLNPGMISHQLLAKDACSATGQEFEINDDYACANFTSNGGVTFSGINPNDLTQAQFGFRIKTADINAVSHDVSDDTDENNYDDVMFKFSMAMCPVGQ